MNRYFVIIYYHGRMNGEHLPDIYADNYGQAQSIAFSRNSGLIASLFNAFIRLEVGRH